MSLLYLANNQVENQLGMHGEDVGPAHRSDRAVAQRRVGFEFTPEYGEQAAIHGHAEQGGVDAGEDGVLLPVRPGIETSDRTHFLEEQFDLPSEPIRVGHLLHREHLRRHVG